MGQPRVAVYAGIAVGHERSQLTRVTNQGIVDIKKCALITVPSDSCRIKEATIRQKDTT